MHPLLAHKSLIVPPQQRAKVVLPQIARGVETMINVLGIKPPAKIVSETPNIVPLKKTCKDRHDHNSCINCADDNQCHFCFNGRFASCREKGEQCPPGGIDVTSRSQCTGEIYCRQNTTDLLDCYGCLSSYPNNYYRCAYCLDTGKCLSQKQLESGTCQDSLQNYDYCPTRGPASMLHRLD